MEAKVRIIDISPKPKNFKNNSKDILSLSFISDNYSVKIEDIEKAIITNEKIIIIIKELKNKIQPIKYSLIRNNNDIIASGEFIPCEGINWYKLNDVKNNMSKESLTSSTSNGNVKNNPRMNNFSVSKSNSYIREKSNNFNSKSNLKSSIIIKIKLSINISSRIINSPKNKKNYTKELSVYSSKDDDTFFYKERDIFNDDDFTVTESNLSKFNTNKKLLTSLKKTSQNLVKTDGITKRHKKINFNMTQSPISSSPQLEEENINQNKTILTNNSKSISPIRKNNQIINRRLLNEDKRKKTTVRLKKNNDLFESNDIISDDEFKDKKKVEIYRKVKSCKNIEDEIIDQNLQNYLKNDEILNNYLSRSNSISFSNQNNIIIKDNSLNKNNCEKNNELMPQTTRINYNNNYNNDNKIEKGNENKDNKFIPQDLNTNSLYSDLQLFKSGSDYDYAMSNNDSFKNIIINKDNNENNNDNNKDNNDYSFEEVDEKNIIDNYEKLKIDFLLLYSKENLRNINNDMIFFEIQLMIEKMLNLQYEHQKDYINLSDCIKSTKNILNNYQYQFILIFKQLNKLQGKKLYHETIDKRKSLYNENISNFIDIRKKIINKDEFNIWDEMMSYTDKTAIKNNYKNKMINVFLNICEKNENHLNKLSLKFYKEIKNKKSNTKNISNTNRKDKKNKYNKNFSERKIAYAKNRIKSNETEPNSPFSPPSKNNRNIQNNYREKSSKGKFMLTKKSTKQLKTTDNYGTMINENAGYISVKKKNNLKNKSSSIGDMTVRKKRGLNKSQ